MKPGERVWCVVRVDLEPVGDRFAKAKTWFFARQIFMRRLRCEAHEIRVQRFE